MNVYRMEWKTSLRSLGWWCLGLMVFIGASAGKFSAMAGDPAGMSLLLAQLPLGLQSLLGVGTLDLTTALGFYGLMFPYLLLMVAVHAGMLGAVAVSREERDKVTEFLYSKPASRARILTAKLLSAFTQVALLNLANTLAAFGMLYAFHESAAGAVLSLAAGMLLVQFVFVTLGAAAAAATDNPKVAAGITTGVILGAYLASVAVDMNGKIDWLKAFTPFSYFDARVVLAGGQGLNAGYVALSLALTAAFTAFAYWQFSRRDLRI